MSDTEWQLWHLDQKINQRGLPIDLHLVDKAMKAAHREKLALAKEIRELTGLKSITPKPLAQWLGLPNMQKETKEKAYKHCQNPELKEVLRLELLRSQTSVTKWDAFMNRTDPVDGVLRGTLQMNGAGRTRRWAGRGVQIQNLKRTTDDMDADIKQILEEQ
jgi:DNA polymerase